MSARAMSEGDTVPHGQWSVGSEVCSIAVSCDGNRVVSGSVDCHVRVWDVRTRALVLGPLQGHSDIVRSVAVSPDDTRITSGSDDKLVKIWDARTGSPIGEPLKGHTDMVNSVAFSPDSARIVSGSDDQTIRIWDARTNSPIGEPLKGHTSYVRSVSFSHDSARIVSGSNDDTIHIWDARTNTPIGQPLRGHDSAVLSVAFSHDSTRIVSGSADRTARIWDARTGIPIGNPLQGHSDYVRSVAFSHDSALIFSGSDDRTVQIWDARTCTPIGKPLQGHTGYVFSVAFSPDSTHIFSGSGDGTISVWQMPKSASFSDTVALQDSTIFDMVTSQMSPQETFECLVKHGCTDLSSSIDLARCSLSAIAPGGFGDVWQAWLKNGTLVAVKCLRLNLIFEGDKTCMKRTTQELHKWSKIRHENVQELLGVVMFQGQLGMVSLWMENGTLYQYIRNNPTADRNSLCAQVATGVSYLHGIGMVHGDIKSLNFLVSVNGIAKVKDFDYSVLSQNVLYFSETTKIGGGTLRWMAPELLQPQEEDGPPITRSKSTDVYALGMTMLEIITGKVPYHEYNHQMAIYGAVSRKQLPRRPKELPENNLTTDLMWRLLVKCWDHEPSSRPNSADIAPAMRIFLL